MENYSAQKRDAGSTLDQLSPSIVRSILESSSDTLFVKDRDLRMVLCSPKLAASIGKRPEELYGKTDIEAGWNPDLVRGSAEKGIKGWERDDKFALEGNTVRVTGEPRTFLEGSRSSDTVKIPLRNSRGEIMGLVGIGRDITEQTARMQQMAEIVVSSDDAILSTSLDGMIKTWNPGAERISSIPEHEAVGRHISFIVPALRQRDLRFLLTEAARGRPVRHYETALATPDGKSVSLTVSMSPIRSATGEVVAISAVARDISERKNAEKRLKDTREQWRTVVETLPDGIVIVSPQGTIEQSSPRVLELWGYDEAPAFASLRFWELFAPESREKAQEFIDSLLNDVGSAYCELLAARKEGQHFPVEAKGKVLKDSDGTRKGLVLVLRDMTEHKRLEQQFMQAQKMDSIGQLAGGVAHDFNNMLSVILGRAQLAMEQLTDSSPIRDDIREIHKAAERSAELTRKLLAFARKQQVVPRVLDVNETIASMTDVLQRLIGEQIELVFKSGADLWPVKVDPNQIDQILANLAANARDAMESSGKLTIETTNVAVHRREDFVKDEILPGEYVLMEVTDTGVGMNEHALSHLFEPFFTTKEVGKGTGLGLATVYGAVKQNGGYIQVQSGIGHGTSFRIYLPRVDETVSRVASAPRVPFRGTETILLVEDEVAILKLCEGVLSNHGYTVLSARSPGEALELAARFDGPIHLLVTDLVMPVMNGRKLRDMLLGPRPGMKALFMSGYTADVISRSGLIEEGFDFMPKPFSVDVFAQKVRVILKAKPAASD